MTLQEMKQKKREMGYSYAQMSELSGVPLGTIQKIFSGETTTPRYDTLRALESIFEESFVGEGCPYMAKRQGEYTVEDYRGLPDEQRVELIDGVFYDMAAPTVLHQRICGEIYRQISNFIMELDGDCLPLIAPVDIQLDCDERTMLQPDIAVLCKRERARKWGVYGSPDFVLEVVSPSTRKKDCIKKLAKYMEASVQEYWILDPHQRKLLVYVFEEDCYPKISGLDEPVPVSLYGGRLTIQFAHILKWIEEEGEE